MKQEFFKSQEVRTNKVQETLQTFGKKESSAGSVSGRSTPAPSRNIGEVFAENKIGRSAVEKSSAQANSWRTKTPEPTVKLVNVSVEKAAGSTQNIHISENAQRQMASFITSNTVEQQSHMTNTTNTMSSQSSVTSHSLSSSSGQVQQPPPAPERLESYGGKSAQLASVSGSELAELDSSQANIEQSVNRPSPPRPPNTASLQSSMSTQSINSVLSTCSSSKIPLPVKNAWFDELETSTTTSTVSNNLPDPPTPSTATTSTVSTVSNNLPGSPEPATPSKTAVTPIPVVANWFENLESKFTKSKQVKNETQTSLDVVTSDLDDLFDELIVDDHSCPEAGKIFLTDDADNCSVQSEATVIEHPEPQSQPAGTVLAVPQSPSEIRKKFQQASSFERGFTKSSEIELSREFKEGIRGKVKESRENFLKQVSSQGSSQRSGERGAASEELQQIKLQRAASQGRLELETDRAALDAKQQEKLRELEAVARSRSKSRQRDYTDQEEDGGDLVQNSYLQSREL